MRHAWPPHWTVERTRCGDVASHFREGAVGIAHAKKLYKDVLNVTFSLEHCWNMLRHLPKWNTEFATKKSKARKESPPLSSSQECEMLEKSEFERPVGRKAAKELQKKKKREVNVMIMVEL
ncbi:hypothetical protein ACET3Z_025823 [Daucus carota]